jgi:hypothetical protein
MQERAWRLPLGEGEEGVNIEHRTSNVEHRMQERAWRLPLGTGTLSAESRSECAFSVRRPKGTSSLHSVFGIQHSFCSRVPGMGGNRRSPFDVRCWAFDVGRSFRSRAPGVGR